MSDIVTLRPQTESEKASPMNPKGFTDIVGRQSTPKERFWKVLHARENDCIKKHIPMCIKCAIDDWDALVDAEAKEEFKLRSQGKTFTRTQPEDLDFEKYIGDKHYDLVDEYDAVEKKRVLGIDRSVVVGKNYRYLCKKYGYRNIVFIPMSDVELLEKAQEAVVGDVKEIKGKGKVGEK